MQRILLLAIASLFFSTTEISAQTKAKLKKTLELKMPKTADDDMCGTRGASVVWHPIQKKYYASFAGNTGYPFAVFDVKGKRLSKDDVTAMVDVRGLWYNPKTKAISGNAYDNGGWFTYTLDKKGIIEDNTIDIEGMNQPDAQSVGVLNPRKDEVLFLNKTYIDRYDNNGVFVDAIQIHHGKIEDDFIDTDDETLETYNYTSIIYTGLAKSEVGLLNVEQKRIELYDLSTGLLKSKLLLPDDAPVEKSFNFAYANGIYWLFSIEKRTWIGYK
ncbi:hypothetical protein ACQ33O_04170 [Ferruginibacter sp. SUN002]|uniref:hypothetical protein n=1 Tax=Ferruginibacter sp. SUN002 TaxID=2937789 RepID=UPI003D36D2A0